MEGTCSRLSRAGLWLSHCSPGAELVRCSRARICHRHLCRAGMYQQVLCVQAPVAIKAVFVVWNRSRSSSFDVNLARDGRDWLPCGCGCCHPCCPCCHWQEPSCSFVTCSFSSTPTHPAGKQQRWFSGTKEGAGASPDPQADAAPGPQPVPVSSAAQLHAIIPNRNRAGTGDSGEEQPLICRAAWPGIAPAPQPPGQATSLSHLTPAVARPSSPVTVTSDRAMAPAKTTKLVPFLTQPAPNESEREQLLH